MRVCVGMCRGVWVRVCVYRYVWVCRGVCVWIGVGAQWFDAAQKGGPLKRVGCLTLNIHSSPLQEVLNYASASSRRTGWGASCCFSPCGALWELVHASSPSDSSFPGPHCMPGGRWGLTTLIMCILLHQNPRKMHSDLAILCSRWGWFSHFMYCDLWRHHLQSSVIYDIWEVKLSIVQCYSNS